MTAKPKTPATPESRIRAAFAKAAANASYLHVTPTSSRHVFTIPSTSSDAVYTVTRIVAPLGGTDSWACNCTAGDHQIVCYHRAAVAIWLEWMNGGDVEVIDGDVKITRTASRGYAGYVPPVEMPEAPQDDAPHPADTVDTFELNLPTDGDEPVHHTVHADTFGTTADDEEAALDRWQDSLERAQVARAAYPPAGLPTPERAAAQMEIDRYAFEDADHQTGDDGETPWSDGGRGGLPFDEPRDDQSDEHEADDEPRRGDGYCPHGLYIWKSTDCDLCWAAEHPDQTEEPDVDDTVNPEDVEPADARTIDLDDPLIATLEAEEQARQQAAKDRRNEPDRWPGRIEGRRTEPRRTVLDRELPTRPATPEYEALARTLAYGDLDRWV